MARYNYSKKIEGENIARAVGRSLPISTKQGIEICNFIRGENVNKAKSKLEAVERMDHAVPMKRFNADTGHKHGEYKGPGRYPLKAVAAIKNVVMSAASNAVFKGMSQESLIISHISAQKGSGQLHYGRHSGREMKRTHIEVIVEEKAKKKENAPTAKKEEKGKNTKTEKEDTKKIIKEDKTPVKKGENKPSKTGEEKKE